MHMDVIFKDKEKKDQVWANLVVFELIMTHILIITLRMEENVNAWVELIEFYIIWFVHLLCLLLFIICGISY